MEGSCKIHGKFMESSWKVHGNSWNSWKRIQGKFMEIEASPWKPPGVSCEDAVAFPVTPAEDLFQAELGPIPTTLVTSLAVLG